VEENKRRKRRVFTDEFKREAVELANKIGISQTEKELDIGESSIRLWRKKFQPGLAEPNSSKKTYQELERENKKQAQEIQYLKEINKVLKKSTAIFSNDQLVNLK